MTNEVTHKAEGNILTIERIVDAPVEITFSAFSDDKALCQWWSPEGFTIPNSKMDFREGGQWHYMMKGGPDLGEYSNMEAWGLMQFEQIDPPKKIVFKDAFTDETGVPNAEMPQATIEFTFEETDGKTLITSVGTYASDEDLQQVVAMGMIDGMTSALAKLDDLLARMQAM